jgi:hypothetical protein
VNGLAVLASCALLTAGCAGADDTVTQQTTSQQTTSQASPETTPAPESEAARSYRQLMAGLPPFDEPASPEVAAWRKATFTASFSRCASRSGAAAKASFVAANRSVLNGAAVFPGASFVEEASIAQRDGNGCPAGTGPAMSFTTFRTYRLPSGTRPAAVLAHYERALPGWLPLQVSQCEWRFNQGPGFVNVRGCRGRLQVAAQGRAPLEHAPRPLLPARPFGAQYPIASAYATPPKPTSYETEPGETCERISSMDAPSVIIPPPPGIRAESEDGKLVVHWTLGMVHGDCPPRELVVSYPTPTASTIHQSVHTASGVTRMRLLDGVPLPERVTARAVSVDGTKSRAVAVLVRGPS